MREIKFRAWCDDKMYKVDTLGFDEGGIRESMSFAHKERNEFIIEAEDGTRCIMFRNAIFMQYTGLKDKNGVEIYESDYIKWQDKTGFIFYDKAEFRVRYDGQNNQKFEYYLSGITNDLEVTGNIYENKQ